ncbi:MAG: transcriptional regulator, TraR/DksA family [Frankiales bacterium]|nr:transcriptional regulator, TraR/DksA family [Frankiales bacterium]
MDLDAIKADLEQIVREAEATIAVMELESEEADESPLEEEELAAAQEEAEQEDALVEAAQHRKTEAEAALTRLEAGTYGVCIDCGEKIAEARLEFRPEASRCLADQEKFEENDV